MRTPRPTPTTPVGGAPGRRGAGHRTRTAGDHAVLLAGPSTEEGSPC